MHRPLLQFTLNTFQQVYLTNGCLDTSTLIIWKPHTNKTTNLQDVFSSCNCTSFPCLLSFSIVIKFLLHSFPLPYYHFLLLHQMYSAFDTMITVTKMKCKMQVQSNQLATYVYNSANKVINKIHCKNRRTEWEMEENKFKSTG